MIKYTITSIVLVCASLVGLAQTNIINTIAGCGIAGYSGDSGAATAAKFHGPFMICVDKGRNLVYVADAYNNVVRQINLNTDIITTIAGNGSPGFSGDGGLATNAQLFLPQGLCIDNSGNLYIADASNGRIRRVDIVTKIITTIAGSGSTGYSGDGGSALSAGIGGPVGLFIDNHSNVYFTDYLNHVVREIDGISGLITTVAGKGIVGYSGDGGLGINAALNVPCDVVIDANGNIVIADTWNHAIRSVDKNTGIISTIAGTGIAGYTGNNGPALLAQLNVPGGMLIDADGNLIFSDSYNGVIRRISKTDNTIATIAGNGTPGYSGDGGPVLDAQLFCSDVDFDSHGNMIIDDYQNDRIRRVSSSVAVASVNAIPFAIFPNPTTGILHVSVPAPIVKSDLFVTNSIGQEVYREILNGSADIDLSNLSDGVYVVHLAIDSRQHTEKVVVMH